MRLLLSFAKLGRLIARSRPQTARRILQAFVAVGIMTAPAAAAEISVEKSSDGTAFILVLGDIESGDGAKFRRVAWYSEAIVLLESDGGTLVDAIEIGEIIRQKSYGTAVTNGSACNSSCALIWLAGKPRALSKSARLGFHAAYSLATGRAQESGVANALVGRYLTLLDLPAKALVFATLAPPSTLNWLTSSNYNSTGIDALVIDDIEWESSEQAKATATATETQLWKNVGNWTVAVDHTLNDDCFLMSEFDNKTVFRIGINTKQQFGYYMIMANPSWKSLREGQEHRLGMAFDTKAPWDVPTTVVKMGDQLAIMATFTEKKFWEEFIAADRLSVWRNKTTVTSLSMAGTSAAFEELISCQIAYDARKKNRDPFGE